MNDWRKPCEHGLYEMHYTHGDPPVDPGYRCPGGSPVDIADLGGLGEKVWQMGKQYLMILIPPR